MDDLEIVTTKEQVPDGFLSNNRASRLEAFDDLDVASEARFIERDYGVDNDVEDDLERQIDFVGLNDIGNEKVRNELLFFVQGLGSVKEINGLNIYVRGAHCEDSLKDIIKTMKRDDPDAPATRLELGRWQTLQNDILPLLITQSQDKQLSFYLMIFLVLITEPPTSSSIHTAEMIEFLQDYKVCFLSNEVINTVLLHLADCLHKDVTQRSKLHDQMIELIVTLFRNLLRVPDLARTTNISEEVKQNLQLLFFDVLHQEQAFEAFVYLAQDRSNGLMKNMNLVLLELFYHVFSAFEPLWIMKNDGETKSIIEKVRGREDLSRKKRMSEMSSRHSRFDCSIKVTRKLDGSSKIIHNPFIQDYTNFGHANQLKKAKPRRTDKRNATIFDKSLDNEVLINDLIRQDDRENNSSLKSFIKSFTLDFLEHAFNSLMEVCYDEIHKDTERVDESDKIHYFIVMGFCLEINRLRFAQDLKAKNKVADSDLNPILEFDMQCIGGALQITHFELLYSTLVREATKEKKRSFNVRIFHASLYAFLQLLKTIKEMSLAPSLTIRRAAQILTQNVFYHDVTKILRIGFNYLNPVIHDKKFFHDMVEFVGIFFDMLEVYCKGKVLAIQTDRRMKKKSKKAKKKKQAAKKNNKKTAYEEGDGIDEEEDEAQIENKKIVTEGEDYAHEEGQEHHNEENNEEEEGEGEEERDESDDGGEEVFRERKFNFASEFAILVDYNVVNKMLYAISGSRLQSNTEQINASVTKFIGRIINVLKADWFFYQIDYLFIFQSILNSNLPKVLIANQQLVALIRTVIKNYFTLFKKNKLLSVESLFRFSDRFIKDQIISNYEEHKIDPDDGDEYERPDRPADDYGILDEPEHNPDGKWNQHKDSLLIKYYGEYENMDNCEEHLCLLLYSLGVSGVTAKDVRKRVKKLRLHKGKARAEAKFKELYCNLEKVSLKESLKLVFVNISDRSFDVEDFKRFINNILDKYLLYKSEMFAANDENLVDMNDFSIVPIEMKDFDILEWQFTEQVLLALNCRAPKQGEIYWRIPGLIRRNEAEVLKEDFNKEFEEVQSHPEVTNVISHDMSSRVVTKTQHEGIIDEDDEDVVDANLVGVPNNDEVMDIEYSKGAVMEEDNKVQTERSNSYHGDEESNHVVKPKNRKNKRQIDSQIVNTNEEKEDQFTEPLESKQESIPAHQPSPTPENEDIEEADIEVQDIAQRATIQDTQANDTLDEETLF